MSLRARVYEVLDESQLDGRFEIVVRTGLFSLIVLNIGAVVLESDASLATRWSDEFRIFEAISVTVFAIEYLSRLWSITCNPRYSHPILGRLRFALTPLSIVDLLAIAPTLLPLISTDLRSLRALRLIRVFRVLKLARYSAAIRALGGALHEKRAELGVTVFVLTLLLVMSSTVMFYFERQAQPEAFSSILAAMWWGVATLSTVGYGDVYPITAGGKVIGAVVAIIGIGFFAMPAAILSSAFIERLPSSRKKDSTCPHCGKSLTEERD